MRSERTQPPSAPPHRSRHLSRHLGRAYHRPRRRLVGRLTAAAATLAAVVALALPSAAAEEAEEHQRALYRAALADLEAVRLQAFEAKAEALGDYPLVPYLHYARLLRYISSVEPAEVTAFRDRFADTPLADRALLHWLDNLAKRGEWQLFRTYYDEDAAPWTKYRCRWFRALLETGDTEAAFTGAHDLWLAGRSQPKTCDPLFDAWRAAGRLTDELAWQRLLLALDAGRPGLASYLVRYLDEGTSRAFGREAVALHRRPERLDRLAADAADPQRVAAVVAHTIRRRARSDPAAAADAWRRWSDQLEFPRRERTDVARTLVRWRARNDLLPADFHRRWPPAALAEEDHADLLEELTRAAIGRGDWAAVTGWIAHMPPRVANRSAWRYWRARAAIARGDLRIMPDPAAGSDPVAGAVATSAGAPAAAATADGGGGLVDAVLGLFRSAAADEGDTPDTAPSTAATVARTDEAGDADAALPPLDDLEAADQPPLPYRARPALPSDAEALLTGLSRERSFYGFMAAERLGRPFVLERAVIDFTAGELDAMAARPAVRRALELRAIGELPEARRELRWLMARLEDRPLLALAAVLDREGWPRQSIQATIVAERWDHIDLRFPLAFAEPIESHARERALAASWLFAVTRQESAFMTDARSHAGALGLMQLMPATARMTARDLGISLTSNWQLLDHETNIRLGSRYLEKMYHRFDRNRVLASAAYNAGPYRVERWLGERDYSPADIWIESIPFRETRRYVQNVLAYALIYGHRLGHEQPFLYEHER